MVTTNDRTQPGSSFGNLGIGSTMVEVQETGVYHNADRTVSKRYRAGTRIPRQEAQLLGIVPLEPAPPAPDVTPLSDADLGERYAQCLDAAGYWIPKSVELVECETIEIPASEQGEQLAGFLREAGYELVKREDQPMTDDDKARAAAAEKRAEAEAEAEAKAAQKPENKQEAKPSNKADAPEPKS